MTTMPVCDLDSEDQGAVDPQVFRTLMGRFATGVTIVTCADGSDARGVTVNAFTAVSLAPPRVLVCLDNGSRTLGHILAAGSFAVNVLGSDQEALARSSADKALSGVERCSHIATRHLASGAPAIPGAIAVLECRLAESWKSGDHTILIGAVMTGSIAGDDDPLLFYAGKYRRLAGR